MSSSRGPWGEGEWAERIGRKHDEASGCPVAVRVLAGVMQHAYCPGSESGAGQDQHLPLNPPTQSWESVAFIPVVSSVEVDLATGETITGKFRSADERELVLEQDGLLRRVSRTENRRVILYQGRHTGRGTLWGTRYRHIHWTSRGDCGAPRQRPNCTPRYIDGFRTRGCNWSLARYSCSEAGCNLRDTLMAQLSRPTEVMDAADDPYSLFGGKQ